MNLMHFWESNVMLSINFSDVFSGVYGFVTSLGFLDVVDILVLFCIFYVALKMIWETKAKGIFFGFLILVILYFITQTLTVTGYLFKKVLEAGAVGLFVVFQPELRHSFEQITVFLSTSWDKVKGKGALSKEWIHAIDAICQACEEFSVSAEKTGAIIVVEGKIPLGEYADGRKCTVIDAIPSKELFGNLFYEGSPLHDGAVIVRNGKILAAGCVLPLTDHDEFVNKRLGTRHRAAIGISEQSDALAIVVSEETGIISIAQKGIIQRDFTKDQLKDKLTEIITAVHGSEKVVSQKKGADSDAE